MPCHIDRPSVPHPHHAPKRRPAGFVAVLLASLAWFATATTAAAEPWVISPASNQSRLLANLFWLTLVLAGVVLVLVEGLLIYSSLRFRRRAPAPLREPPQIHGNTRLEVMWAIVPASILIGLFAASIPTLNVLGAPPADAMRIKVTGFQFAWDFEYPSANVKTTGELRIPAGQPVVFEITSRDVIHSFWVPQLQGKIDAIPGKVNQLWLQADQPGTYRGVCAELCGAGHSGMLFSVQVLAPADFQAWLAAQPTDTGQPAAAPKPGA